MNRGSRWTAGTAGAGLALFVALLGGLATEIGPWYLALRQAPWKPPDRWFGPAWTLIYACTAMAGVQAWLAARRRSQRLRLALLFLMNAGLNIAWSLLFFKLHRPDWALWEVGFLWASIGLLMGVLGGWCPRSRWLLLPYLLWVGFAAALNAAVVALNGPFGGP